MKDKNVEYCIESVSRTCYQVIRVQSGGRTPRRQYLTNFKKKRAAKAFIEEYKKGNVSIDPETNVPTPDFV